MSIRLQITNPTGATSAFDHAGPSVRVGRDPAGELILGTDGPSRVSWNHARIDVTPAGVILSDLRSTNGTIRNGAQVQGATSLVVGDTIQFGTDGPTARVLALPGPAFGPSGTLAAPAGASYRSPNVPPGGVPAFGSVAAPAYAATPSRGLSHGGPSATRMLLVAMQKRWHRTAIVAGVVVAASLVTLGIYTYKHEQRLDGIDEWVKRADTHFGRIDSRLAEQQQWNEQAERTFTAIEREVQQLGSRLDAQEQATGDLTRKFDDFAAETNRRFASLTPPPSVKRFTKRPVAAPSGPVPPPELVKRIPPQPARIQVRLGGRLQVQHVHDLQLIGKHVHYKRAGRVYSVSDEYAQHILTRSEFYSYDFDRRGYAPALTHYNFDSYSQSFEADPRPMPGRDFFASMEAIAVMNGVQFGGYVSLGSGSHLFTLSILGRGPASIPAESIEQVVTANGVYVYDPKSRFGFAFISHAEIRARQTERAFARTVQVLELLRDISGNFVRLGELVAGK